MPQLTAEQLEEGRKIAHQRKGKTLATRQQYLLLMGRYKMTEARLAALDAGSEAAHRRPRTEAQLIALAEGRRRNRKLRACIESTLEDDELPVGADAAEAARQIAGGYLRVVVFVALSLAATLRATIDTQNTIRGVSSMALFSRRQKHVLVVQLDGKSLVDYDRLIAIEDRIIEALPRGDGDVDGHDMGSGEMNIFVVTDLPERAFELIHRILADEHLLETVRVAYRRIDGEKYTVLWPVGLEDFRVT
jgi:hypothetical protein